LLIACPVKSSKGGLPKAAFNRVKLMIDKIKSVLFQTGIQYLRTYSEPVSKYSILPEVKKGENFNRRNTGRISRIKI